MAVVHDGPRGGDHSRHQYSGHRDLRPAGGGPSPGSSHTQPTLDTAPPPPRPRRVAVLGGNCVMADHRAAAAAVSVSGRCQDNVSIMLAGLGAVAGLGGGGDLRHTQPGPGVTRPDYTPCTCTQSLCCHIEAGDLRTLPPVPRIMHSS